MTALRKKRPPRRLQMELRGLGSLTYVQSLINKRRTRLLLMAAVIAAQTGNRLPLFGLTILYLRDNYFVPIYDDMELMYTGRYVTLERPTSCHIIPLLFMYTNCSLCIGYAQKDDR